MAGAVMHMSFEKPVKGTAHNDRVAKRVAREQHEQRQKALVRARDGVRCRWPSCDWKARRDRLEIAHVVNKSQRGSNDASNLIRLCVSHHQGRPSLHSGELRIVATWPELGTNGPCAFEQITKGMWKQVARETAPGVVLRD